VLGLFIFGFLMQSVNNWAHAGGLLGGIAMGFTLGYEERAREKRQHRQLAGFLALLTAAVLAWAVLLGLFHGFF
jgi:rhomboid protease GluP